MPLKAIILNEKSRRYIYETAYIVYLAELILFNSVYGKMDQLQQIFALVRVTAYLLVCTKLFLDFLARSYSVKEIGVVGIISSFLLWTTLHTGNKAILIYWAFIVGAHDVEFEKLIKWSCIVHVLCLFFVIASSYAGIIENRLYSATSRKREALGFQFATESSNYFFYTILMWIYWKKEKITWKELVGLAVFAVFLFQKTDTKSAFTFSCIALVLAAGFKAFSWFRRYHKCYLIASAGCVPLFAYGIFRLSVEFTTRIPWMKDLDKMVSGRLGLGKRGYRQYGVPLWGQRIEWIGGTAGYEGSEKVYNYVDSSYMQILLNLGLVFLLLLILLFCVLGIKMAIKRDSYFFLTMLLFAMHSTFDPQIIWMEFNTFVMLYSYLYWKGEKSFYLERLKGDIFKHKRLVGTLLLVFVLAFGKMGMEKAAELENRKSLQQQKIDTYESNLVRYESEISDLKEGLVLARQQIENLKDYVDNSPYMQLNGEAIPTATVRYQVSTEANMGNILNSLIFYINEGGLWSFVEREYAESTIRYWREMVSCSANENILSISVMHYDGEEAQRILDLVKAKLLEDVSIIGGVQGMFTLAEIENFVNIRSDSGVTTAQTNRKANLDNYRKTRTELQEKLAGVQKSKQAYMEKNQPGDTIAVPNRTLLVVQYAAVGVIVGSILVCLLLMLYYLLCDNWGEKKRWELCGSED